MGPKTYLNTLEKRKVCFLCLESNHDSFAILPLPYSLLELSQSLGRDVNQTWQDTKYLRVVSTEVRSRSVLDEGNKEDTKFY
jgi:hypothetical protein